MTLPSSEPAPESNSALPGWLSAGLLIAASLWIVSVTGIVHLVAWFVDQFAFIGGTPLSWVAWPVITWGHALLLAIPVVPLALLDRAPRTQAVYRVWLAAIVYVAVLALVRVLPPTWSQTAALGQIAFSLSGAAVLALLARSRGRRPGWRLAGLAPALALVPLVSLPALLWGALGSPLDSVLGLLAALSFGLFAGLLLGLLLFSPLAERPATPGRDLLFGAFAAGITLVILASGFGFGGGQLFLLISLPPLGFAAAGLSRLAGPAEEGREFSWLPLTAFVGLATAAPLIFTDPEELTLLLGGGEILYWAFWAACASLLLAWLVGLALLAAQIVGARRAAGQARPGRGTGVWLGGAALAWLFGIFIYFFAGQPGFYGERLFVIFRDQADVTAAAAIPDRAERLAYVYDTLTAHADDTQSGVRATLDRLNVDYTPYYLVNAIEVDAGPLLRVYLNGLPEVDRILDDERLRPVPRPAPVETGSEGTPSRPPWNITYIGADKVWEEFGVTGAGIVIGQSDSGVQGDHPALRDGYRGRNSGDDYNWLDPWNGTTSPTDPGGHGTHTLGSILGRGGIGVAPGAEWFACSNLARNLANPALYLDCMQFMLAPYPQGGDPLHDGDPTRAAHVLNNSWGCPPLEGCDAGALEAAARALRAAGIFVAVSAGNEGPRCGTVSDPIAIYDEVFTVGAMDRLGDVAGFSSRGPVTVDGSSRVKPDILAPGVGVLSSMPGDTYGFNDGTSMAGPHVAGAVALLWSAQPSLIGDIDRTEQILQETADPYHGVGETACSVSAVPTNTAGYGVLNVYEAVRLALGE